MAKREECAFCTKFRQGAYGPQCSFFGRQPVFDGTSCAHNDGTPPSADRDSTQEIKKIENTKTNSHHSEITLKPYGFLDLPRWWTWFLFIVPITRFIIKYNKTGDYISPWIVVIATSIYFLVAWGKLGAATKKERCFSQLIKLHKINVVTVVFIMLLGMVISNILSILLVTNGFEWSLNDVIGYCCWFLSIVGILFVGVRFNRFENTHLGYNDQFGTWLIIYGVLQGIYFITTFIPYNGDKIGFLMAFIDFVFALVDFIYAYNIILYSNNNMLYLSELYYEKQSKDSCNKQVFAERTISIKQQSSSDETIKSSSTDLQDETKNCPFCGEEIKANAKKCRYCGEWLEK